MRKFLHIISIIFLFISINVNAQEENEKLNHFRIGVTLGHGYIPQANSNSVNFLIIPTIGLDVQYWYNEMFGVSIKSDLEIATYVLNQN